MRIVFVRHGQPDYATDSLTELGKIQAESVVDRLIPEKISEIYSSTMGRSKQTAEPFAKRCGLPITELSFMREIGWGSEDPEIELPFGGHPWLFLPQYINGGNSLVSGNWKAEDAFVHNKKLQKSTDRVIEGADAWLAGLGFVREGEFYRVTRSTKNKTVVIFSHHGASNTFISHMLNIPLPLAIMTICPYFASVSIIKLDENVGELIIPKIEILTDSRHVPRDGKEWIQKKPD